MTTARIYGKQFPESRKCPSQSSSLLTNAISAVARTSRLSVLYEQGTRSRASAPKGIWRSIFALGLPGVFLFVLVLGMLQRDVEVSQDGVVNGVPSRPLGTDGPRLRHRTCPNKSQSVPIQSSGLPRVLLNVGTHIHVPPLRKAVSYSFIIQERWRFGFWIGTLRPSSSTKRPPIDASRFCSTEQSKPGASRRDHTYHLLS